jgi:hypothetical protein
VRSVWRLQEFPPPKQKINYHIRRAFWEPQTAILWVRKYEVLLYKIWSFELPGYRELRCWSSLSAFMLFCLWVIHRACCWHDSMIGGRWIGRNVEGSGRRLISVRAVKQNRKSSTIGCFWADIILQMSEVTAKLKLLYLIARQTVPTERTIQQPYWLGFSRNSPQYLTRRSTVLFTHPAIAPLFGAKKIHYTLSYTYPLTCILVLFQHPHVSNIFVSSRFLTKTSYTFISLSFVLNALSILSPLIWLP